MAIPMANPMTTFESPKEGLRPLLAEIGEGKIQLPDFQRDWVWTDEQIADLLASISLSYPVGAVMMLETGVEKVQFHCRPVEGVNLEKPMKPDRLILDGQQRLTSLYMALASGKPVRTWREKNRPIHLWYYMDMRKALDPYAEREEAVFSVPENRIVYNSRRQVTADYTAWEKEYESGVFPLHLVYDDKRYKEWRRGYQRYFSRDESRLDLLDAFESDIYQRFLQYQLPVIVLKRETPNEAVCQVFEKVNTGGQTLTVFELLTATYAADRFSLRDDWETRKEKIHGYACLRDLDERDFLTTVTLYFSWKRRMEGGDHPVRCKRRDVLRLSLKDYRSVVDEVERGLERAGRFLIGQKIFTEKDVPYQSQLIALGAILTALGGQWESVSVRDKLARWFWCGVFGEWYGSASESRAAQDLPEFLEWVNGGKAPSAVAKSHFSPQRLYQLKNRNSAAYKGLYALLMRHGGLDFRTGESIEMQLYSEENIDIHHIFPKAYSKAQGLNDWDCIINKIPISSRTNRIMGGIAPSRYLLRLEKEFAIDQSRLDEILLSHLIPVEALRNDD